MRNLILKILSGILILSIVFSCKKGDEKPPVISVNSPFENQHFSVFDTVEVVATISDETSLKYIQVVLTNSKQVRILNTVTIEPSANAVTIKVPYHLSDFFLESGLYYMLIKASDGINFKNQYISIYINEIQKNLESVFAICRQNNNLVSIYRSDSILNMMPFTTIPGDFQYSALSSRDQLLFLAGKTYANLNAFDIEPFALNWDLKASPNPPFPHFTDVFLTDDHRVMVAYYEGYISRYTLGGVKKLQTIKENTQFPVKVTKIGQYIVGIFKMKGTGPGTIKVYYYNSGLYKSNRIMDLEVTGIAMVDNHSVLIFGNKNHVGKIYKYYLDNDILIDYGLILTEITSQSEIINSKVYVGHKSSLGVFDLIKEEYKTFDPAAKVQQIKFETLTGNFFISDYKKICVYKNSPWQMIAQMNLSDTIIDFHFQYNK